MNIPHAAQVHVRQSLPLFWRLLQSILQMRFVAAELQRGASRGVLSRGLADAWVGVVGAGRNGGGAGGVAVVMWSVLIVRVPVRILNRRCVASRSLRATRAVIVHSCCGTRCLRGRSGLIHIRALRRRPLGLLHFGPAILKTEGRNSPRLDQPARLAPEQPDFTHSLIHRASSP